MNKHIDQSELSKLVATHSNTDPTITEAFISQLFREVEKEFTIHKSSKLEGLGSFKIIKSGSSNRILFLGSTTKNNGLKSGTGLIGTDSLINKPIERKEQSDFLIDTDNRQGGTTENEKPSENATNLKPEPASIRPETDTRENGNDTDNRVVSPEEKINRETERENIYGAANIDAPQQSNYSEKRNETTAAGSVQRLSDVRKNDPYRYISESEDLPEEEDVPTKKRSNTIRIATEILIIFVIVSLGFVIYSKFVSSGEVEPSPNNFTELDNNDTKNFSCVILTDSDVSIKYLAKAYYGNEEFWPYIYKANENIVDNRLTIPSRSIIRIPKVTVDLVSFNKGELNDRAKALEEEIMKNKS